MWTWIAHALANLRERNVTKALLLYTGSSWVLIGILDIALPILQAPERWMNIALILAAIGLVLTGIVSWFFELTESGWVLERNRVPEAAEPTPSWLQNRGVNFVIIGSLSVALLLSLFNNFANTSELGTERALREVAALIEQDNYVSAYVAIQEIGESNLGESKYQQLVAPITDLVSVATDPAGAAVRVRPLGTDSTGAWQLLGTTPIVEKRLAKGIYEWRFDKAGFVQTTRIERNPGFLVGNREIQDLGSSKFLPERTVVLEKTASQPATTVAIPGGTTFTTPYFGLGLATKSVAGFNIAQYETTNEDYAKFVAAGAYRDPSFWPTTFRQNGETKPFEDLLTTFVDTTGRPGPAGWAYGKFLRETALHPVSGLSWFEAQAYAKFVGGALPTIFQFGSAAFSANEVNAPLRPLMLSSSNFTSTGSWSIQKKNALGPFGTFDMLGNVREWAANAQPGSDMKYILGGSWMDPPYITMNASRANAFDRSLGNGVRVVFNHGNIAPDTSPVKPFPQFEIDHSDSPTVSDEKFDDFRWAFASPAAPLAPELEETRDSQAWVRKQISIAVGPSDERMSLYLYLPKGVEGPFQPIIFFPGFTAFAPETRSSESVDTEFPFPDFVLHGGRALVFPVFAGAYERYDGQAALDADQRRSNQVSRRLAWIRELGRVIDYLETDNELNAEQVGFLGISFGAARPLPLLAVEPRLKAAILMSGGISFFDYDSKIPPIGNVMNYVVRVKIPTLMINGRYDNIILPTQQESLFNRLGTPLEDKKWVQYDTGHWPFPKNQMVSEVLAWMDKYLGEIGVASQQ